MLSVTELTVASGPFRTVRATGIGALKNNKQSFVLQLNSTLVPKFGTLLYFKPASTELDIIKLLYT